MQVSKIIEVLQSRYQPDQELMVDWWDEGQFIEHCQSKGLTIPEWSDAVEWYECSLGVDISEVWFELTLELEKAEEE